MSGDNGACRGARRARELVGGAWRLLSYETRTPDGIVRQPFGPRATGIIMYEPASGYMSGQMMRPDRPVPATRRETAAAPVAGTPAEIEAILGGYLAYSGRYDVDAEACLVTHHVECALLPEWVGIDLVRHFTLEADGNRVVYRTPTVSAGASTLISVLVWERIGAAP